MGLFRVRGSPRLAVAILWTQPARTLHIHLIKTCLCMAKPQCYHPPCRLVRSIYLTRCRFPLTPSQDRAFEIQDIPDKGKGIIATRAILAGELILLEAPLFTLPSPYDNSDVLAELVKLTESEQRDFFSLSNCHRGRFPPPIGICRTNALPCGDQSTLSGETAGRSGIFLLGSRFNSCCIPNVNNFWVDRQEKISFRALRDIEAGEELCICYTELFSSRAERQRKGKLGFGFNCMCTACTLPEIAQTASDERRDSIQRLSEEIALCGYSPSLGIRKVRSGVIPMVTKLTFKEGKHGHQAAQTRGYFGGCRSHVLLRRLPLLRQ